MVLRKPACFTFQSSWAWFPSRPKFPQFLFQLIYFTMFTDFYRNLASTQAFFDLFFCFLRHQPFWCFNFDADLYQCLSQKEVAQQLFLGHVKEVKHLALHTISLLHFQLLAYRILCLTSQFRGLGPLLGGPGIKRNKEGRPCQFHKLAGHAPFTFSSCSHWSTTIATALSYLCNILFFFFTGRRCWKLLTPNS